MLITGATSGIGKETAKALAAAGARVVITARNMKKGSETRSEILTETGNDIVVLPCDLASQQSIKDCFIAFSKEFKKLDVLINNAGVWNTRFKESPDGIEETFALNVMAPYIMVRLFKNLLMKSADPRVITVSSGLHFGSINFKDIEYRKKFSGFHAYRQSKLAVILLTRFLAAKPEFQEISLNCMHPGLVNTSLGRHGSRFFNAVFKLFGKSPARGADTLIYMASWPKGQNVSGEYFVNRKIQRTTPQSYDMQTAERLLRILDAKRLV